MIDSRSFAIDALFCDFLNKSRKLMGRSLTEKPLQEALLLFLQEPMRPVLAEEAVDDVDVGLRDLGHLVQNDRRALVGGEEHRLGLGNDSEERNAQKLEDVFDRQHLALTDLG